MAATRSARRRAAANNFWGRLVRAVPFQKLKIMIVVWQILTQVRCVCLLLVTICFVFLTIVLAP